MTNVKDAGLWARVAGDRLISARVSDGQGYTVRCKLVSPVNQITWYLHEVIKRRAHDDYAAP